MIPALAREEPVRDRLALSSPWIDWRARRLASDHAVVVVEHDDGLAALLEEHPAARRRRRSMFTAF